MVTDQAMYKIESNLQELTGIQNLKKDNKALKNGDAKDL